MKITILAVLIIIAGLLPGCRTVNGIKTLEIVPGWVSTPPREKGTLCAVGASEPTFYKEDGKTYAAENARKELARSLNLNIQSIMVDVTGEKGGNTEEGSVMEVSSWASEAVLKESQITAYWFDENGIASFRRKNITYALACMPLASKIKDISRILPGADDDTRKEFSERLQNINNER